MRDLPIVDVVVPCYNEEPMLPETDARLRALRRRLIDAGEISGESLILYVDDGSGDDTWRLIEERAKEEGVAGIKLARNAGKENALMAGMMAVRGRCDAAITIDADLQDDPEAIPEFIKAYKEGAEIVFGVRKSRDKDSAFKRLSARGYYGFMRRMGAETVFDHADYRLMGRRALDALSEYPEANLYLRGLVPRLGFKTATVAHDRGERLAGETKYPLRKMVGLAMQGITSSSAKPIHWVALLGGLFALLGAGIALYALIARIAGQAVPGWTSIMISIWIVGGVQLIALGLIGEYVGKAYIEAKRRPRYAIEKTTLKGEGP